MISFFLAWAFLLAATFSSSADISDFFAKEGIDPEKIDLSYKNQAVLKSIDSGARLLSFDEALAELSSKRSVIFTEIWPHDIAYVRLGYLDKEALREARDQLTTLASDQVKGTILDLRGAGGDSFDAVDELASLCVTSDILLYKTTAKWGTGKADHISSGEKQLRRPIIVLVDERTDGASSLLAGILLGKKGIIVIGSEIVLPPIVREYIALGSGRVLHIQKHDTVLSQSKEEGGVFVKPDLQTTNAINAELALPKKRIGQNESEYKRASNELLNKVNGDPAAIGAVDILMAIRRLHSDPDIGEEQRADAQAGK